MAGATAVPKKTLHQSIIQKRSIEPKIIQDNVILLIETGIRILFRNSVYLKSLT